MRLFTRGELLVWLVMGGLMVVWPLYLSINSKENIRLFLAKDFDTADGIFVEQKYHNVIIYRFLVRGRMYGDEGSSDEHHSDDLAAGEQFVVYYSPADPRIHSLQNPLYPQTSYWISEILLGGMGLTMLAIIIMKIGTMIRSSLASVRPHSKNA